MYKHTEESFSCQTYAINFHGQSYITVMFQGQNLYEYKLNIRIKFPKQP